MDNDSSESVLRSRLCVDRSTHSSRAAGKMLKPMSGSFSKLIEEINSSEKFIRCSISEIDAVSIMNDKVSEYDTLVRAQNMTVTAPNCHFSGSLPGGQTTCLMLGLKRCP